jgi:hypothetical protein
MHRPYRDLLTGNTVMLSDEQAATVDRSRFKRLDPYVDADPVVNPEVEVAQDFAVAGQPIGDFWDTPYVTQQQHAATLPDNPPYPQTGDPLELAGKPDTQPPKGPNAS